MQTIRIQHFLWVLIYYSSTYLQVSVECFFLCWLGTDIRVEFVVGQGKSGSGFNTCWGHSSLLLQVNLKHSGGSEYGVSTEN